MQDAAVTRWSASGDEVRIVFEEHDPAFTMPRHAIEFGIAWALLLTRKATGRALAPRRIELRHSRPANDAEARRVFASELRYGAEAHAITLARADLELPLLTADPQLAELLDRHARALEERLPARRSFTMAVRGALAEMLASGEPKLDGVAARLRVSRRTLQRRLRDEGTSHVRVLDELRRDLAVRYFAWSKSSASRRSSSCSGSPTRAPSTMPSCAGRA